MPTIATLLADARRRLAAAPFHPPAREAVLLLGRVLGLGEAQVMARDEQEVAAPQAARFADLLRRRLTGEPVAYLLGEREFYGRPFFVDRRALIPRPQTEHLVETALGLAGDDSPRILDVGTGSGCVAVTLALELPQARLLASDISPGALAVAGHNARRHGVRERLRLAALDLVEGVDLAGFDLVVSNPPYVDERVGPWLSREVRDHEPHVALFAADGGGAVVLRLLAAARHRLRPGAWLLFEIGSGQFEALEPHLEAMAADLELHQIILDYSDIPRVVVLRKKG